MMFCREDEMRDETSIFIQSKSYYYYYSFIPFDDRDDKSIENAYYGAKSDRPLPMRLWAIIVCPSIIYYTCW